MDWQREQMKTARVRRIHKRRFQKFVLRWLGIEERPYRTLSDEDIKRIRDRRG